MDKRMSVMGIGPRAGAIIGVYLVITIILSYIFSPLFRITDEHYVVLLVVGSVMFVVGFTLCLAASMQMLRAYKNGKLATTGFYAVFLHPMYFFQLYITLPGLTLLFNSWLVLTTVIVAILCVKILVKEEDKYLAERFGEEYDDYRRRVKIRF